MVNGLLLSQFSPLMSGAMTPELSADPAFGQTIQIDSARTNPKTSAADLSIEWVPFDGVRVHASKPLQV
jgi:hypothetical protein